MEVHPILEPGDNPSSGLWYVISSENAPDARVGMACAARNEESRCISNMYVIGGATPDATFSDVYRLDLRSFVWSKLPSNGLHSRYEHSAFIPQSFPNCIYTFGGADEANNLNSMQVYELDSESWSVKSDVGSPPKPRTLHCAGSSNDLMYVFGGGKVGAEPIDDPTLHIYDAKSCLWSQKVLKGDIPSPRHGHVMVVVDTKLFIHGGMAGPTFYDDLYKIDSLSCESIKVKQGRNKPTSRAGHYASSFGSKFYIFGGMNLQGALDDMYSFDATNWTWSLMKFDCPPPAPRLDHSILCTMLPIKRSQSNPSMNGDSLSKVNSSTTIVQKPNIVPIDDWHVTVDGTAKNFEKLSVGQSDGSSPSPEGSLASGGDMKANNDIEYDLVPVCIIMGGMDTSGNLFNDIFLTKLN